ncbi:MAG: type I-U CRISPR-associated protein Cas5/Cas6 [Lamprocystis purpurea]|jgi:CRISPR-associated protein Csb2|uniref:type I-G CRISPR-associated protein Csb2 n=1 Tax=Lamprocystis purpurea TaxID=61598 RepID=UPI0003A01914|nr:type I-U CRISPR-associated protein Csb2 [Lamprocystis purpurea]MBV5273381.1 type I-U CRISPR-associated protein Cas5/Cas6 [Lamprocystis purpurea]
MAQALVISVRLFEGRYHGAGDWPPAPARVFQALISGSAIGDKLPDEFRAGLAWLEGLPVPLIAAPRSRSGQRYTNYVPNNDLDHVGGDPKLIGKIRDGKLIRPQLFNAEIPLIFCWLFDSGHPDSRNAQVICKAAKQIYQLGCGIDMAWAWAEVLSEDDLEARLTGYVGTLFRPTPYGQGVLLDCPIIGSLTSLETRYAANLKRFSRSLVGNKVNMLLTQAPKPYFRSVVYNSRPFRRLFEIRASAAGAPFAGWSQERTADLVARLRDTAASVLTKALPEQNALIERRLIGRDATGRDIASRIRIIPLPSIGHAHVDRGIRRVLLEVPTGCEIAGEDIAWAFSGLLVNQSVDINTGEVLEETRLTPTTDMRMLEKFGIESDDSNRLWRTVTPAALPQPSARRRIDPNHLKDEIKGAKERLAEEARAGTAVLHALRHAGVRQRVNSVRVQREPFAARGARAEAFAAGTRFAKERLWHAEIQFAEPIDGPLIIGDGRYLGLGLLAPVRRVEGAFAFAITDGLVFPADPEELSRALRRAVMARVQAQLARGNPLPAFFSGHAPTGDPLREGNHGHLAFAADLSRHRLLILAPHLIEARAPTGWERNQLATLNAAVKDLIDLRAGVAGRLTLLPETVVPDEDPLFAPAQHWESVTDYRPTRHAKRVEAADALVIDVLTEIRRSGIPEPAVEVLDVAEGPRGGLAGRFRLRFRTAQAGPLLIGRTRHFGGGLFQPVPAIDV